ncbi:hypothetical protein ACHAXT_007586 [Thalassiosira profunda]
MKSRLLLPLLAAGVALLPSVHSAAPGAARPPSASADEPFVVAGYLPDYRSYIDVNAAALHLTDLMLFSLTPAAVMRYADGEKEGGCCLSTEHYEKVRTARQYKSKQNYLAGKMRLLLTVGGGGRSDGFKEIVSGGPKARQKFLKGLVQLCHDEELDGIDMDYEGIQTHADWNAYLNFLTTASSYLHQHGLLLTVALHPGQLLPPNVCKHIDRVHIMSYDMLHPTRPGEERPTHHASLDAMKNAIAKFVQKGCPPSKLVAGIPAYGRHEENPGEVKTYSEVIDEYRKEADAAATSTKNEELQSLNSWKGYRFDSPDDVRTKVRHVKEIVLGGVFIWELGQDKQEEGSGGMLLEAAATYAGSIGAGAGASAQGDEL